jgi:hypothetical protein
MLALILSFVGARRRALLGHRVGRKKGGWGLQKPVGFGSHNSLLMGIVAARTPIWELKRKTSLLVPIGAESCKEVRRCRG